MRPIITFGKRFVELMLGGNKVSYSNAFPTRTVDGNGREAMNSVFGDSIIGQRVPTVASQFRYPLESGRSVVNLQNGGGVNNNDSQLRLTTAAQANSLSEISGTFYLRYIPGHEAYSYFTMAFNTPTSADSYQRIGLFDGVDGFYLGYKGTDFVLSRLRNGVRTETIININTVFESKFNVFNPQFGNVYKISFGYLGYAPVSFEVMQPDGSWITIGKIMYPNSSKETHISNTYLPIRAELFNGSSAQVMEMASGSVTTGIVDGAGTDPGARRFSYTSGLQSILAGNSTFVVFRNKTTYGGLENRVSMLLTLLSASTDGNKNVKWRVIENPTITTPGTWQDINTADSIIEYNTSAVVDDLTGKEILPFNMAKSDSFLEQVKEQNIMFAPGDIMAIQIESSAVSEVLFSMRWEELF